MSVYNYLKNALIILIFLQLAPALVSSIFKQYTQFLEPKTQVGLITISGVLEDSGAHSKHLRRFFKNHDIKALLIKMDCRGSTSGTGYALYNEIKTLKAEFPKPVVVLVENVCASGGYWIACAADYIIAPSVALIGSIGVTFPYLFQLRNFLEQYNIQYTPVQAGQYKNIGNPFVDVSPADKALLQSVLDDEYKQFTQAVAQERKLALAQAPQWANGKVFTGNQAKQLGLIDEIGSLSNAIKVIKDKALVPGEIEWIKPPARAKSLLSYIIGSEQESGLVSSVMNKACTYVENRYSSKVTL